MKTYTLDNNITINGSSYAVSGHTYPAPYERNDRFILLGSEQDSRNPASNLEPESGYLLYADLNFEYNYYSKDFENFIPNTGYHQRLNFSPSLNLWLINNRTDEDEDGTADYQIDQRYLDSYNSMYRRADTVLQGGVLDESLSKEYFEGYNNYFTTIAASIPTGVDTYAGLNDHFGEILQYEDANGVVVPPEFVNKVAAGIYADQHNTREAFPFYAKFHMTGVRKSEFCDLLEDYNLEDTFIDFLISTRGDNINAGIAWTSSTTTELSKTADAYGYTLDSFGSYVTSGQGGSSISAASAAETACEYFENFINQKIFEKKVESFLARSPDNHAFPVAFRLEKRLLSEGNSGNTLVSVKYFFNYTDLLEFKYYDSQVFYRGRFIYRIRVINGIVKEVADWQLHYDFPINKMIFIEEPYYEEELLILDSPPIAPDVELITYRGIDNKVLILLNQMIDQKVDVPVIINESDLTDTFKDQYTAQGIPQMFMGKRNPILFESDDPTDFELFKSTKHPVSWDDFRNEHYKLISSGNPKMSAASYLDIIVPNQHYYYMFRAQDVHGHISNPSAIYEFVLNKEGETLYPKIRIVDFAKPEPPVQKAKTFKKYLKIGFSPRQYQIPADEIQNIDDSLVSNNINIGIAKTDNIIGSGRTFKFRIRSKNTGKLIDINVTFKKNKVINA